jgi:adenylate cyclase
MTTATPHRALICKGCWQQMRVPVPLRGPWSVPFRLFGLRPSRMNPNTCTLCELMFTRVMRARNITVDVTVMFADLRGYTALSRQTSADGMSHMLDSFYDECAAAIWHHDGLLNKTIGDAVMAIFNFPIRQDDHAAQALRAARVIQDRCRMLREAALQTGDEAPVIDVGIGIDSGAVRFGEFGRSVRELTAIGNVVNTAARAQGAAAPGEILLTRAARDRVASLLDAPVGRAYDLKGFAQPVELFAA